MEHPGGFAASPWAAVLAAGHHVGAPGVMQHEYAHPHGHPHAASAMPMDLHVPQPFPYYRYDSFFGSLRKFLLFEIEKTMKIWSFSEIFHDYLYEKYYIHKHRE